MPNHSSAATEGTSLAAPTVLADTNKVGNKKWTEDAMWLTDVWPCLKDDFHVESKMATMNRATNNYQIAMPTFSLIHNIIISMHNSIQEVVTV